MNKPVTINNLPIIHKKFCVCLVDKGKLWYCGSWDDLMIAKKISFGLTNTLVIER